MNSAVSCMFLRISLVLIFFNGKGNNQGKGEYHGRVMEKSEYYKKTIERGNKNIISASPLN